MSECFLPSCGDTAVLHLDLMRLNTNLFSFFSAFLLSAFTHWTFWITLCSAFNSQRQSEYIKRIHHFNKESTEGLNAANVFYRCWQKQKHSAGVTESFHPFCSCFIADVAAHENSHQEPGFCWQVTPKQRARSFWGIRFLGGRYQAWRTDRKHTTAIVLTSIY